MMFFLIFILAAVVDMTLYNLLGVKADATQAEINSAFKKKLLTTHPDKIGNTPGNVQRFQELSHARDILSDPELREKYDTTGNKNPQPKQEAPKQEAPPKTKAQQAKEKLTKVGTAAKEKLTKIGTAGKEFLQTAGTATKDKLTKLHTNTKEGLTSLKTKVAESKAGQATARGVNNLKSFSAKQFEAASQASKPFREKTAEFGSRTKDTFTKKTTDFTASTREAASKFKSTFTKSTGNEARPAGQGAKPAEPRPR